MEDLKVLEIESGYDKSTGILNVVNFEEILGIVNEILNQNPVFKIENDSDKKICKERRANLNKCIKAIDRRRIDLVEEFTTEFTSQCKQITELLDTRQKELGVEIKAYEDSLKEVVVEKPKVITATLKYQDAKLTEKIIKFAEKYGIELSIK